MTIEINWNAKDRQRDILQNKYGISPDTVLDFGYAYDSDKVVKVLEKKSDSTLHDRKTK